MTRITIRIKAKKKYNLKCIAGVKIQKKTTEKKTYELTLRERRFR